MRKTAGDLGWVTQFGLERIHRVTGEFPVAHTVEAEVLVARLIGNLAELRHKSGDN
jgi:hypothetical protein